MAPDPIFKGAHSMPLRNYGVVKGRPLAHHRETDDDTPHYQIHLDAGGTSFRLPVNVKSSLEPSQLVYFETAAFIHPLTDSLVGLAAGFHALPRRQGGGGVDYIRSNPFDFEKVIALPHHLPGMDNDLSDLLESRLNRAMADPEGTIYAFGERWGPEGQRDKVFHFAPGNGVHDIHMNQGNAGRFVGDDGIWQDGALLLHYPAENRWSALFLAFQSQALHTDDVTGHALPGSRRFEDVVRDGGSMPPPPDEHEFNDGIVRIVGALVNPVGHDPGLESVTLLNLSPEPIDLAGWQIANRNDDRFMIAGESIGAGETMRIALPADIAPLGNNGGEISLLDRQAARVHGVAYTSAQASRQGWTLAF
jgi:uncharacterized protein YukJ